MTKSIVDALELPPGPDGKAHPDFWIYTNFNGQKSPRWRPALPSDLLSHDGSILPDAARSIAWLWDEAKLKYGENEWQRCQRLAWYSCARGEPDYTRLPVVAFGDGKYGS